MTGEEFRELRVRKHITQMKLGEMLGYKGRSAECVVQSWEYGRRPIPMKHFRKLSEILGVPLERFIP